MKLIIIKKLTMPVLFFAVCLCLNCDGNSRAVSKPSLINRATPPNAVSKQSANTVENNIKGYLPADTCKKIKSEDERFLCEVIIKDQNLTGRILTSEFIYASKRFDLNGDGRKEVIVLLPTVDLGGTSGYPVIIFSQASNGYRKLLGERASAPIIALESKSRGWRDIAFQIGEGDEDADRYYEIDRYNGKFYDFYETRKEQPKGELLIDKDGK